jgi:hypothetical protein
MDGARARHEAGHGALSASYVLGYAFHGLSRVRAQSRIHGKTGVLALLGELFDTLAMLRLERLGAALPLRLQQQELSKFPRSHRVGSAVAAEIGQVLPSLAAAVHSELAIRTDKTARARYRSVMPGPETFQRVAAELRTHCTSQQQLDLADGCRALDQELPTAAVFHLYRVWEGFLDSRNSDVLANQVPDPRKDAVVRSSMTEALVMLAAIRRRMDAGHPKAGRP